SATRTIFHIDLDCFFVSVALRDRPDLVDKPVAVTHSKGVSRGFSELASVNYAARKCGLKNGMIVRDAIKLCPNLVCMPYLFDEYRIVAKTIYTVRISDPQAFAEHLRAEIRQETGCPASVGIGKNVLIARLATRHAKPDGVRFVLPSQTEFFIANEKVKNLPGMGYQTYSKIVSVFVTEKLSTVVEETSSTASVSFEGLPGNVEKCRDLQMLSRSELERVLGKKVADQIYKMCRGEVDEKNFVSSNIRKSISCDINYGIRFTKVFAFFNFLFDPLCLLVW
ncbi:unnamed protein product, partial [Angiostrongylus costaricensis]|uniref:UmuC domain-containing protein n=1 Tax=Angiostrongylus costaricensis TaxID=334426 RepID=A0A0R3PTY1_ANGCS